MANATDIFAKYGLSGDGKKKTTKTDKKATDIFAKYGLSGDGEKTSEQVSAAPQVRRDTAAPAQTRTTGRDGTRTVTRTDRGAAYRADAHKTANPDILKDLLTGAGKTYAASFVSAPQVAYAATQGARDRMTDEYAAEAQYTLDRAKRDYEYLRQNGASAKELQQQQNIVDEYQRKVDAFGQSRRAQVGAATETAKLADAIQESGARDIARAEEGMSGAGKLLANTAVAGAQMLGDVGIAALTGGGAIVPMMFRSFGGAAQTARQKGYSTNQQLALGLGAAATAWATEKMFGGNPLYDNGSVGIVNRVIGKVLNKVNPQVAQKVMGVLSSPVAETLNEGWEEVIEDLINPLLEQVVAGNHDEIKLAELAEDWIVGAALGGMGQGVAAAKGAIARSAPNLDAGAAQTQEVGHLTPANENAVTGQETPSNAMPTNSKNFVERYAPTLGKAGAATLTSFYNEGQDAATYTREMTAAYNAGRNGAALPVAASLNRAQSEAAYNAGQADAQHIDNRSFAGVGKRNVQAFQYQHPEIHQYYAEVAEVLRNELRDTEKGGQITKIPHGADSMDDTYLRSKRQTTPAIATLLDEYGFSYADIDKALTAIIEDNGQENIAVAKRLELLIDDLLENDYFVQDEQQNLSGFIDVDGYRAAKAAIDDARVEENVKPLTGYEAFRKDYQMLLDLGEMTEDEVRAEYAQQQEVVADRASKRSEQTVQRKQEKKKDTPKPLVHDKTETKRWQTTRNEGGTDKTPLALSEIVEKIRHDFDVNITTGHIRGKGVRGQYNRKNNGIRTKAANNITTIAHELGHYLDNNHNLQNRMTDAAVKEVVHGLDPEFAVNYKPKEQIGEGIAEYFREYLKNTAEAKIKYPIFTAFWKDHIVGKDVALIEELADEINASLSLDTENAESSLRARSDGQPDARTFKEKARDKYDEWYQKAVDSNHGIKLFSDETGDFTAYMKATNAAYSDAVAAALVKGGDLFSLDGEYVGFGLKTALNGVNLKSKQEYLSFNEYLVVKNGQERLKSGLQTFANPIKDTKEWMANRQAQLEAQYPRFNDASERLYEFIGNLYQTYGVNTGMIEQKTFDEWRERWKYYVPFNRAVEKQTARGAKRGFANQNSTVKKARGGGQDIYYPVDNLINNLVMLVNAGTRNNVVRQIVTDAEKLGADATLIEEVPMPLQMQTFDLTALKNKLTKGVDTDAMQELVDGLGDVLTQFKQGNASGDVISVLIDGKRKFFKVNDPLLLNSLTNLDSNKRSAVMEAYGRITRLMTSSITGLNVVWALGSNMPRDIQTMFTFSEDKAHPLKVLKGVWQAYVNRFKKAKNYDYMYKEYLSVGGGQSSVYTADMDLARKSVKEMSGNKLKWLNPLEWLEFIGETVESGPRYAAYKLAREKGLSPQEAIYIAHEITVNFRRGGTTSREINKFVPFFNAGVQGLDRFARYLSAEDMELPHNKGKIAGRETAAFRRTAAFVAGSALLGVLAYAINNGSDDDKKEYSQLSNYTKNSFWLIPLGDGRYFAIPKARELSVLSSFFEAVAERMFNDNEHAFDEFWSYFVDTSLPAIVSDIASIPAEGIGSAASGAMSSLGIIGVIGSLLANRDFLGRPIVSQSMQNLEPRDQYNSRTSKLAKLLGGALNVSPLQIDYFFQQAFGGFQKWQRALFPVGSENVDLTLGIQNTYVKDNQYSTDLVNRMYDRADDSTKKHNSAPNDIDKAITAAMDGRMTSFYSAYNKLAKTEAETAATRGARQTVLNMLAEYEKAAEHGTVTKAEQAVYDVVRYVGNTSLLPSVVQSAIKDGNEAEHTLSATQYVEYQTDYNRLYWEYVEDNLGRAKKDREKLAVLTAAKTAAATEAKNRALARIGAPKIKDKYSDVSTSAAIQFKAGIDIANDDGSLKQEEVIEVIRSLNLSREESSALFMAYYPKSKKNNPWRHNNSWLIG